MNSTEQYLESQILAGVRPEQALADLIIKYQPKFAEKWNQKSANYGNFPDSFKIFSEDTTFKQLNFSDSFVKKWFIYPSGHTQTSMSFAGEIPYRNLSLQNIIITDPLTPTKISIRIDQGITPAPCLGIINGSLYIPVLRYQRSPMGGLFFNKYEPDLYCGTFYFLDPGPGVYLLSNKTLIAPTLELAYYYVLGGDELALNTVIHEQFKNSIAGIIMNNNSIEILANNYKNWLKYQLDSCLSGTKLTPLEIFDVETEAYCLGYAKSIEQQLCYAAREKGIEVIILIYITPHFWGKAKIGEVIDVGKRQTSYESLFKF